jgi:RND family efflux transporter MFP subunit
MRLSSVLLAVVVAHSAHAQAPEVVTRPLAEVAIYLERDASAQTVALNESRIAAEIAGRIEAIPVMVGSRIARGAVVARIDCRDHELSVSRSAAALEATRSRLALAEQQLARAQDLQTRTFLSAEALAGRETEARVLRAEAEQARAMLASAERVVEKCVVRAPFDAIVRERLADVGELAAPGTALAVLLDAVRLEVAAQVQVRDAESLAAARAIRFEGDGGERSLKLLRISPAIDPQARTVEARLAFAKAPAPPGAAGRIVWRDARPHVPAALVVRRGGRLGVFVEEHGKTRFVPLPQAQEGRPAAVDLPLSTLVVTSGHLALQDSATPR